MKKLLLVLAGWGLGLGAQVNPSLLAGLQWRNIGSFRAGRAGAVCGVPGQPGNYYMGAMQGGFWKSVSASAVWVNVTDKTVPEVAAINTCAVAASDPNEVLFSSSARGPGMYRSGDGGQTWEKVGPVSSPILIDPKDAKIVIVGRAGAGGGVFRSTDGGRTFTQTFTTGVGNMEWSADNPSVIYATVGGGFGGRGGAAPVGAGGGSTLFRSNDEGLTFQPVAFQGINAIGSFSVAGASHSQRLYALGGRGAGGGLYRSDDGGANWTVGETHMNTATGPVYADTQNPNMVYILGTAVYRSTDGGKTIAPFKGSPGGDDPREWWIDPTNDKNIEYGGDQGASISVDAGYTWTPWYNQPTAQLYHLTVDNRFPYWVYGSQQDSGTVATKSRGDFGQINAFDWLPFPGWEAATLAVDPLNSNIVYANGNYGDLEKVWLDTMDSQIINPIEGHEVLRRDGNSPIVFSPEDPHTMYVMTQYVLATHDGGNSFTRISPDLSVRPGAPPAPGAGGRGGGGRGSIGAFAASPVKAGVLWAAAAGGGVWTTNDAKDWTWLDTGTIAGVTNLEASHFDPLEAYMVASIGPGGGTEPAPAAGGRGGFAGGGALLYRTRDGGKTWQPITNGLPTGESTGSQTRVIREDPKQKGLLFAGTETQVLVSFDDGDHWQSLRLNAPNTSWRDLVIHGNDLVAATYGRSFWVLDDIAPLRAIAKQAAQIASAPAYLFAPSTAVRLQRDNNFDTPIPPEMPHAANPPEGAILYYNLAAPAQSVTIEITDAQGRRVRTLSNVADAMPADPLGAVPEPWKRVPHGLPTDAGMHRVNWDLRWTSPEAISVNYDQDMSAIYHDTPATPLGPKAVPGIYTVKLTVDGKSYTQALTVTADPRLNKTEFTPAGMQRQLILGLHLEDGLAASLRAYDQIAAVRTQLKNTGTQTPEQAAATTALDQKLAALQGAEREAQSDVYGRITGTANFAHLNGVLARLLVVVDYNSDAPPVASQEQAWQDYCGDFNTVAASYKALIAGELANYQPKLAAPPGVGALTCGN